MTWQDQIQVEKLPEGNDDLRIVNTARVSFGKWIDTFNNTDAGLLSYLAKHEHTSPFRHVRETIAFDSLPFDIYELTPFDSAGLVFDRLDSKTRVRTSFFGWVSLLKQNKIFPAYFYPIIALLNERYPFSLQAYGLAPNRDEEEWEYDPSMCCIFQGEEHNPWFKDYAFRCKAPIWLTRQLVKHQVGMSWNEISRRYVDSPVELFDQEFRAKPDGSIKQGSGEVVAEPLQTLRGMTGPEFQEELLGWYDGCIEESLAPETVRGYMPLNMMTEWIWTGSLPAWEHMLKLRLGHGAQKEAVVFAQKLQQALES